MERAVTLLPLPDSPTIPSLQGERDTIDRLDDAILGPEMRLEVVYFEHRHGLLLTLQVASRHQNGRVQ
jgi:hypothetical protein